MTVFFSFLFCLFCLGGLSTVQSLFDSLDLGLPNVYLIRGWFHETVPIAPVNQISILRLDGDLYESTMTVLKHFYPRLSIGGILLVDDYCTTKQLTTIEETTR